ncbi:MULTISPECIES: ABC transporter transmembrane domain-containing protein [unclassified Xanthobacter]|uniref:ABC transporter transmembrane domain-containing protein n=1 Tax=unclassified Xanthobacter TaxID=2623496 RepID=UPI001EFEF6EF|nr:MULTISPECIES: ABC transporter transmembrane domain-containing protein [unclassified Xanthobacter]
MTQADLAPEPAAQPAFEENARPKRRSLGPLKGLWPHLVRYRGRLLAALGAILIAALATLALPLAVRRMIDFGFAADQAGLVDRYFEVLVAVVAVLAAASAARYYLVTTLGERVVSDLRTAVFARLVTLDGAFYDTARSGELTSRLTADTTQIKAAVGASASTALRNLVLCLGSIIMMVVTSAHLSGLVLIAIPIIVLPLVAAGRKVRSRSRAAQDTLADASAYAAEALGAMRSLQASTAEGAALARFGGAVERAFGAAQEASRARAILTAIGIFLVFASIVVVLWVGAQSVLNGTMSAGALSQFVLYAVLAASSLGDLSQTWGEASAAAGAAERIAELLKVQPQVKAPAKPTALPARIAGAIRFEEVSFAYPSRPDANALHNIAFEIRPGERVALVGPSGAGKSTVFQLLERFYDPQAGRITFDGIDIHACDPVAVRHQMALVPQEVAIFADTVRGNIRLGRPDATDAEVEAAGRAALVDEFVARLPQGWDTQVGERGVTLSGGQRQRIVIARAILRAAPILLLDEATSALDAESETLVQTALERSMEGRTTLVIAHRLATVLSADRILVMEAGRVVDEGSHAELVAKGGLYARLAALQFNAAG